ncbi:KdpD-like non-kinase potassium sensor [Planococcus alpniumensis]|uniref:KdpD-like non-kinase potassium sensor n=1 Tax=Planococcus alpniumensis TaxID=2708345 RepID=UPI001B8CEC3F|nr:KdpD-like non-kinase potassium sensor [Planococcus sp. MSAK28401]
MPEEMHPYFRKKTPDELLEEINEGRRGKLKLYIGAAPGVGKTYKMLQDAHDLKREGIDVTIGYVETHRRSETEAQIGNLEQIPLMKISYKGRIFDELNIEEIKRRAPEAVIIDELAHTNIPGSKHVKRYMDVDELLEAGIDVISAVNIQHLESVHDIVRTLSGVAVRERVPDRFIQKANEVQFIDASPETLRKRLEDGKIYAPEKIQQSLENFFTTTNLSALRELALREIADDVDERIEKTSGKLFEGPVGIHEKILVCVHYGTTSEKLIRRGYRMANRLNADLYILTVADDHEPLSNAKSEKIKQWMELAEQFNATFILEKRNNKKPEAIIIDIANKYFITQILLGQSARTRWEEVKKGSIVNAIMRKTSNIDIHIVADNRRS